MAHNHPPKAQDMVYKHDRANWARVFKRLLFLFSLFFILGIVMVTNFPKEEDYFVRSYAKAHLGEIWFISYFSIILLFPFKKNKWATAVGIVISVAGLFTDHFFAALIYAGMSALIIDLYQRGPTHYTGWLMSIFFIFLFPLITNDTTYLFTMPPLWFYLFFASMTLLGLCPSILKPLERFVPEEYCFWPKAITAKPADAIGDSVNINNTQDETESETEGLLSPRDIERHRALLTDIKVQLNDLPEKFVALVNNISDKTDLILDNMKKDNLDILPGNRFLNRYLPIVQSTVDRLVKLNLKDNEHLDDLQEQAYQALDSLSTAFTNMHHQLLQNDVDDLMVDLKVVNKLLKTEGLDR